MPQAATRTTASSGPGSGSGTSSTRTSPGPWMRTWSTAQPPGWDGSKRSDAMSDREIAAVHGDGGPRDEAGVRAGEEGDDTCDLLRGAEATHGRVCDLGVMEGGDL